MVNLTVGAKKVNYGKQKTKFEIPVPPSMIVPTEEEIAFGSKTFNMQTPLKKP